MTRCSQKERSVFKSMTRNCQARKSKQGLEIEKKKKDLYPSAVKTCKRDIVMMHMDILYSKNGMVKYKTLPFRTALLLESLCYNSRHPLASLQTVNPTKIPALEEYTHLSLLQSVLCYTAIRKSSSVVIH